MLHVEKGARFPEFREKFLIQRGLQIADSFRPAGAALRSNHPLHHLDVMRTPEREVFIMLHQRFGELKLFISTLEVREDFEYRLRALADIESAPLKCAIKRVSQRRPVQTILEPLECKLIFSEFTKNALVFQSRRKLDLAKLHRLKTTRRIELIAKREKADWRHGFEDVNLLHEQLFNLHNPFDRARCAGKPILLEKLDRSIELVKDLFEPELVRLVHSDEQQLIVMRRIRKTVLQTD